MSSHCNPSVVEDGLVFLYDVDDIQSYKGEPTVNLVGNMTKRFNNWNGLTGTSEYYTTSEGNQGVKVVTTSGTGGVQWYTNSTMYNIQASTEYTISATVKYLGGTPHPNLLYVRQYDGDGQTSESGKFTTANQKDLGGGWKRIWRTFTTDSTTTHINLQGYQYYSGRTIYIQDLQFELKSHATQFAGASTTRSSTQGLIDRTGTSTIDISNASFDSNAQMTFDGTDDYINDASFDMGTPTAITLECIIRFNGSLDSADRKVMHYNKTGGTTAVFQLRKGHSASTLMYQAHNGSQWYTMTDTDAIESDTWAHFMITHSGTSAIMYKNGVQSATATMGNLHWTNASNLLIGYRANSEYWKGDIPIMKLYNRALTAAEVLQNFKATKSRFGL